MKKGLFMKATITVMFIGLILFTIKVLHIFETVGSEPSTLITSVFAFCGIEGGALAWIRVVKTKSKGENENE